MLKKIQKKLHTQKGFTLAEMLVCLLILLLASGLLVNGVVFASTQFNKSFAASETQVVKSTLKSAIAKELRYTHKVYVGQQGTNLLGYQSETYGRGDDVSKVNFEAQTRDGASIGLDEGYGYIRVNGYDLIAQKTYSNNIGANVKVAVIGQDVAGGAKEVKHFEVTLRLGDSKKGGDPTDEITFDVLPVNYPEIVYVGAE